MRIKCLNTGKIYVNAASAMLDTGVIAASITRCCNNKAESAGMDCNRYKLHWCYIDDDKSVITTEKIRNLLRR
jgi:hypothetical protein